MARRRRQWGFAVCCAAIFITAFVLGVGRSKSGLGNGQIEADLFVQRPVFSMSLGSLLDSTSSSFENIDIAEANLLCADGLPGADALDVRACLSTLDRWAIRVRAETERHWRRFERNPGEFEHSEGYFRMLMMAVALFEDFHVRYNPARIAAPGHPLANDGFFADSRDVFLHGLLGPQRMGTCSSMPVLYSALARRLGYPIKLVTTKGHLFLRWEGQITAPSPSIPLPSDGRGLRRQERLLTPALSSNEEERGMGARPTGKYERFNLEATGQGMNRYEDEHYRRWPYPVTDEEVAANGFLKSLNPTEEVAVFLAIRAQCLIEAGRPAEALLAISAAIRLAPDKQVYPLLLAEAGRSQRAPAESVTRWEPPSRSSVPDPSHSQTAHHPDATLNPLLQPR